MAMTPEQVLAAMTLIQKNLEAMQENMKKWMEAGGPQGGGGSKKDPRRIEGKLVDNFRKFAGGESEWNAWADDLKIVIDTRSEEVGTALEYVRALGKSDKEVLNAVQLKKAMYEDKDILNGLDQLEVADVMRLSKELYRAIHMATTDEAKTVVRTVEDGDGFEAWGKLNAKYSQKTLSRMMRLQQECMYPKVAKVGELVSAVLEWEARWKRMEREQARDIKLPPTWKMAAMLKLCPKEIQDMVELRWDEIGEEYEKLRDRVIGWATTRAEKKGGPVPMDVDGVDKGGEKDEENDEDEYWDTNAVTASTQCYNCQGYGHTSWQCPSKGKGKGGKGGGKGSDKGKGGVGGKGWQGKGWQGKGGWEGVEAKGGGKGAAKGGKGKGDKGGGKGWGYQGVCWKCNKIGHKANECTSSGIQEASGGTEETPGESIPQVNIGGVWNYVKLRRVIRVGIGF